MDQKKELIEKAKEYVRRGFSVIPVKGNKRPAIWTWREFQERRASEAEIEKMFARTDVGGVAVITGTISDVVVLDCEAKADLKILHDMPKTMMVKSGGGGTHFYFKNPKGKKLPNREKFMPEMDFRGEHGYAVLPPSSHDKSGGKYEWIDKSTEPAEMPEWLQKKVLEAKGSSIPAHESSNSPMARQSILDVKEGERNSRMTSFVGKLLGKFPESDWPIVREIVNAVNRTYDPPLLRTELMSIVRSITSREQAKHTKSKFSPISVKELFAQTSPEIGWVVDELFPKGTINMITGKAGDFKTWTMLHIAAQLIKGAPIFGRFKSHKTKVLIVDEESQPDLLRKRLELLGVPKDDENIKISSLIEFKIDKPEDAEALQEFMEREQIGFVIFDCLIRVNSKDENVSREIDDVFKIFKRLTLNGTSVLIAHHNRKQQMGFNSPSQSVRGSSDIMASLDTHLAVVRPDPETVNFTQTKLRQAEPVKDFKVKIVSTSTSLDLVYESELAKVLLSKDQAKEEIIEHLDRAGSANRSGFRKYLSKLGTSAIDVALRELEHEGTIGVRKGPKGKKSYSLIQPRLPLPPTNDIEADS